MHDEMRDEVVDEMPEAGGAPCGQIFGGESDAVAEADDEMPPPGGGHCGDPFASPQTLQATDADA